MNNCFGNYGTTNAVEMCHLLEELQDRLPAG
jgi:hypothetical protein